MNKKLQLSRKLKGLKLKEFAQITGVDISYLSRIENGERPVPLRVFGMLTKEFERVDLVYNSVCEAVREFYREELENKEEGETVFAEIIIKHLNKMLEI